MSEGKSTEYRMKNVSRWKPFLVHFCCLLLLHRAGKSLGSFFSTGSLSHTDFHTLLQVLSKLTFTPKAKKTNKKSFLSSLCVIALLASVI